MGERLREVADQATAVWVVLLGQKAQVGLKAPEGAYRKFKVMGKEFDPAQPDAYLKSFAIQKVA